jgi:hypothetical protein
LLPIYRVAGVNARSGGSRPAGCGIAIASCAPPADGKSWPRRRLHGWGRLAAPVEHRRAWIAPLASR